MWLRAIVNSVKSEDSELAEFIQTVHDLHAVLLFDAWKAFFGYSSRKSLILKCLHDSEKLYSQDSIGSFILHIRWYFSDLQGWQWQRPKEPLPARRGHSVCAVEKWGKLNKLIGWKKANYFFYPCSSWIYFKKRSSVSADGNTSE